jgi:hypothetical protein
MNTDKLKEAGGHFARAGGKAASAAAAVPGNVVKTYTGSNALDNVAAGVVGAGAGIYLVKVGLNRNGAELLDLLKDEGGYLQVLVAMYALYLLYEFVPAQGIMKQLIVTAFIGVAIEVVRRNDTIIADLEQFGKDKDLGAFAKKLFGG